MASTSQNTFAEGQSTTRPPFFDGTNYGYWKMRMQNFLIATDYGLWLAVKDGIAIIHAEKDYDFEDIAKIQKDARAKNSLYCALAPSEFDKISSCDTAKEIWDKLEIAHEGTNQVKETKINLLIHEYESFSMKDTENIGEMFGRFQKITNALKNLGEVISQARQVKKILRSLSKSWMPKVTAIQEAKDLDKMTVEELMGSLMTHEVLVSQKEKQTEEPKGKKTLALKADSETESEQEECNDSGEDEEIAMLSKRIKTLMMRKKKGRHFPSKEKKKFVPTCYKCKKPGHMQYECNEKGQESKPTEGRKYQNYFEKKGRPFDRRKRAMMAWDMIEALGVGENSENEQEEQHEAQMSVMKDDTTRDNGICFMALEDDEEVIAPNPDFEEMLNELYNDFLTLENEHAILKKKFAAVNTECIKLKNEKEKHVNDVDSKKVEILRAENNALRNSLATALQKLKVKKEPVKSRKRKNVNHNTSHMWIPKVASLGPQVAHTHYTAPKMNGAPKFNATNPPGPTLMWVPKSKV